jgi:TonB family protein
MKVALGRGRRMQGVRGKTCLFVVVSLLLLATRTPLVLAQTSGSHRKVLLRIEPDYPAVLRNGHFEGQVRLEATVLENGSVHKVEIKGGSPIFAKFAAEAVSKWKYAPGPPSIEEVVFNFSRR